MQRRTLAVLVVVCLALIGLGGCHSAKRITVEPVSFDREDECVGNDGFIALADRRVFAVMAFLNACGYDHEVPGRSMHPTRVKVRRMVAENLEAHSEKHQAWRDYYDKRRMGPWQYVDFALSLSSDYPFRRIRADSELGYSWTATMLADFPGVLNDFWVTARLEDVWAKCKPDYTRAIKAYDPDRMARQMAFLWQYLRLPRRDTYTIVQIPNPLERHATASGARYENYFYSIDGPGSSRDLNVHEYLHTIVNPLVDEHYAGAEDKLQAYYEAGKDAEISKPYQKLTAFTSECLVHALDYRLAVLQNPDEILKRKRDDRIAKLTRDGYTLLGPLHAEMAKYEAGAADFAEYFPTLLDRLPEYAP